ncbi:cation:proton antiporter [Sorangium cellulosum]|uniref:Cation:proton antiporter n=1 Tax=Sorangium cellulosum TaxID=56 RepID=A0A4P2PVB6_SORCE|nr:sodium:proton antiporter [Sorangium cellulosum]AUX20644.1 cation:proton antiporter [Sorangium cellulosum]
MTGQLDTAVLVTVLAGGAIYLCLSRRFLRVLLGFLLLSNAANLVVLSMSGDPTGRRAAMAGSEAASTSAVDPVPQALILTAIVIGFSVAAYLTVLLYRIYVDSGSATTTGLDEADDAPGEQAAR